MHDTSKILRHKMAKSKLQETDIELCANASQDQVWMPQCDKKSPQGCTVTDTNLTCELSGFDYHLSTSSLRVSFSKLLKALMV